MIKITVKDLLDNCDAKLLIGDEQKEINECFINSKDVTLGSTFFGIRGKNTDGSLFYKEAFLNGADICIINKIYDLDLKGFDDKTVIIANDTLKVLHELAFYKRNLFKGKVIAVTGSVGKTSTKELIANVLSQNYKVLKTKGNQNSQLGLPLTILRLTDEDIMVLEMGMNDFGQIHNLSLIAKPNISVITNIYDSHIGILGSRENILKAKLEIIDGMNSGTLIINNDNDLLMNINDDIKENINVMSIGIENKSNVMPNNILNKGITTFDIDDIKGFEVMGGLAYVYNALFAYLTGKLLNVSRSMIKKGVNEKINIKHRLELIKMDNNITLIDDCYNASFDSVRVALEYIKNFSKRKIAILGDILELGKKSKNIHKKIGKLVIDNNIDRLITIGKYSKYIGKEAKKLGMKRKNIKHFKCEKDARKYINDIIKENDIILVKGSNGMKLIELVNYLKKI